MLFTNGQKKKSYTPCESLGTSLFKKVTFRPDLWDR